MRSGGHITVKNPNPQGKGLVPTLRDLGLFNPGDARRKTPVEFFRDYCLSSLVLAARFRFRPVVGREYYLYSSQRGWLLSLVSPREWRDNAPGVFVARCALRRDMTWTLSFDPVQDDAVARRLHAFVDAFSEVLYEQEDIGAQLPFFAEELPYYQRVLATALASSLSLSSPPQPALRALLGSRPSASALAPALAVDSSDDPSSPSADAL